MKRTIQVLLSIVLVIAVLGGAMAYFGWRFIEEGASESDAVVVFEIRPGESFKAIAKRLEDEGLVRSAQKFKIYARMAGLDAKTRVGEYAIRKNMKPKEVLAIVTSGHSVEYVITVQEGFNRFEIAEAMERQGLVKKDEFLALTQDPKLIRDLLGEDLNSLEGYLFPETYHVTKFTGARGLIRIMVERFKENYAKVQAAHGDSLRFSRHELVTLASIIEKETGAPEERPVISSVFHNRLQKKMRLQTDPTVIYGIWEQTGQWNRNISREDLLRPTRYNTYSFEGLPPGPISNPGLAALAAAAAPAQTEFIFFVSRNDGTHTFSRTYDQHRAAVTQFQVDRKAREGKSWRDLNKREQAPDTVVEAPTTPSAPGRKASSKKPAIKK